MRRIDSFIRYHDIDVARCLAVLLFADAVSHLYGMVFGGLFFASDNGLLRHAGGWAWMIAGVFLGLGVWAAVELWFAVALWQHRPTARAIAVGLAWLTLGALVAFAVVGPFLPNYAVSFGGFSAKNPGPVLRVVGPLLLLPVGWLLLQALRAPATSDRFARLVAPSPLR